jgi:hypothetical protein
MQKGKIENITVILIFIIISLVSAYVINVAGPSKPREIIAEGDGCGHFDYLPLMVIYHTVDFEKVFQAERLRHSQSYMGHYFHKVDGVTVNKYTSGTSLMIFPFYMLAYWVTGLWGIPPDGFSLPFQYSIVLAAIFWLVTGLWFFVKLLRLYGISIVKSSIAALLLLFSTNLFHYAFVAPAFSHVYSFAWFTILLYNVKSYFLKPNAKNLYLSALAYGLIILIRPVNAISLLALPAMASSKENFLSGIMYLKNGKRFFIALSVVVAAISPQLLINYLQTGNPLFNGYINEGFYFGNPQIINFLFGYRKGWFVYTPVMLFVFPALIFLYKRNRFAFYSFLFFFAIQVYIFSSWWNWFYGDSFGMRPMVEYYGFYFLFIVLFFENLSNIYTRLVLYVPVALFLFLNLFQTYQYAEGIIHPDAMDKESYWYVFLKSGKDYKYVIGDCDESFYGKLSDTPFLKTRYTTDGTAKNWSDAPRKIKDPVGSGKTVYVLNKRFLYSPTYVQKVDKRLREKKNIYVDFDASYYEFRKNEARHALFVVNVLDTTGKNTTFYKTFKFKRLPDTISEVWRKAHIGFKLPVLTKRDGIIKYYIWYRGNHILCLDDLELEFYTWEN